MKINISQKLKQLSETLKLVGSVCLAVILIVTLEAASARTPTDPGTWLLAPASQCSSEGDSWLTSGQALGQPERSGSLQLADLDNTNSAVFLGGNDSLACQDFFVEDNKVTNASVGVIIAKTDRETAFATSENFNLDSERIESNQVTSSESGVLQPLIIRKPAVSDPQSDSQAESGKLLAQLQYSTDGTTWTLHHNISQSELSGLVTQLNLDFPSHIAADKNLQLRIVPNQLSSDQALLVGSVFLNYQVGGQPKVQLETDNNIASVDRPELTLKTRPEGTGLTQGIVAEIKNVFSAAEPSDDVDVSAKVLTSQGRTIEDVDIAWVDRDISNNDVWNLTIKDTELLLPGRHAIVVTVTDQDGFSRDYSQDFSWGVLAINTDKDIYRPQETISFEFGVLDDLGQMVCDADVVLEISGPGIFRKVLSTENGEIVVNSVCNSYEYTELADYEGSWQLPDHTGTYQYELSAVTNNGSHAISGTIEVNDEAVLQVRRNGPTRIYPPNEYPMSLSLELSEGFVGEVVETVPVDFELTELSPIVNVDGQAISAKPTVNVVNERKMITWSKVDTGGDRLGFVNYRFDAPNVSPEFWLLGPLQLNTETNQLNEDRSWQIASDAVGDVDLGRWTGGVQTQGNLPETWTAPNGLFPTQARNDNSHYTFTSSTSSIDIGASDADGYLFVGRYEYHDASNGRFTPQCQIVQTSGTGNFVGPPAGSYSRNNSEDTTYVSCWGFVDNPSDNADFQFQWKADADDADASSGTQTSSFDVIPLYYAEHGVYSSTSSALYGGTTPNQVTGWTVTNESDTNAIELASNQVTVKNDNKRFLVFSGQFYEGRGGRTQRWFGHEYDNVQDNAAKAYSYYRNGSNDENGNYIFDLIETSTANRTIEATAYRGDGVANNQGGADLDGSTPGVGDHAMVVLELYDNAEVWRSHNNSSQDLDTAGIVDINVSPTATVDFNDSASFTRASDSAVDAAQAMDALFGTNMSSASRNVTQSGSAARLETKAALTVNSTEDTYVTHGNYHRGNQGSADTYGHSQNPVGFLALASGDDVGASSDHVGGQSGDVTAQTGWTNFWGLNLDTLPPAAGIDISGTIYSDDGVTALSCLVTNKTVNLRINGAGSHTTECTTAGGAYSFTGLTIASTDIVSVYLDNETEQATSVFVSDATNQTNADLYQDRLITRADTGNITNTNLSTGDDGDADVVYNIASGNLTVDDGNELHIWTGDTFVPGGTVTTSPSTDSTSADGDVHIDSGATLNMAGNALSIGGDFDNEATLTVTGTQTTTFTGTDAAPDYNILTDSNFRNLVFNGSGGEWFINPVSAPENTVDLDLTVTAGTLLGDADIDVDGGDVTGNGDINLTDGLFTLDGTGNFGGNTAWNFHGLTFGDGTGTETATATGSGNIAVGETLTISTNQTLAAASKTWQLDGIGTPFVVNGTFNEDTSTFEYNGAGATNVTAETYYNLSSKPTSGSPTHTLGTGASQSIGVLNDFEVGDGTNSTSVQHNTNDPDLDVDNDLIINSSGQYHQSGSAIFTLAGDFNRNGGDYFHNGGDITFDNAAKTSQILLSVDTFFGGIVSTTPSKSLEFDETEEATVLQDFTIDGQACNTLITLDSTDGSEWDLDISGATVSVEFADIEDSNSASAESATDSFDSGSNTNWTITEDSCNAAPNDPTSLVQRKIDDTVLATGDWTDETSIEFTVSASDPDSPEDLQLCIEIDLLGTAFSNAEDSCSAFSTYTSPTAITIIHTITGLTDDSEYHWQARLRDNGGAYSNWVSYGGNAESARDVGVDTTAPTGGTVFDGTTLGIDADYNGGELDELSANWSGIDTDASGLDEYEYSIGTSPGATDITSWTSNGTSTSITVNSLTLNTSQLYYYNVRTTDNAGNQAIISSDGLFVAPTLSFSASPSGVSFSNLNSGNSYEDSKTLTLTTSTNAYNGYVIRAYVTGLLTSPSSDTIGFFDGGTYAAPDEWLTGDRGYGYTSSDTTIQGVNKFNPVTCAGGGSPPCYAPFTTTSPGDIVADHTDLVTGTPVTNENFIITHRVKTDSIQAAGTYTTIVIYSVIAEY